MKGHPHSEKSNFPPDDTGQATIFVVLVLGIFLLAALGFAVDIGNLWFHRQTAQTAADAACTAEAMDLLFSAESVPTPGVGSWGGVIPMSGAAFDCASNAGSTPCRYASLNGYNGAGLVSGTGSNQVTFAFSNSFSGLPVCSPANTASVCLPGFPALPVMQVTVAERVTVFFAGLIAGSTTMDVGAKATCGVVSAQTQIPIVVLDPINQNTLDVEGIVAFFGGPQKSIQVNSNGTPAADIDGTLDLSHGGPSNTGSDLGVYGGPGTAPGQFSGGMTGVWRSPASPVSDPFATLAAPRQPPNGTITHVAAGLNGCPDIVAKGCDEYTPGFYPAGISVANATAIFDSGVYYLGGTGLTVAANSIVRPSTLDASGTGGTMFYFSGPTSTLSVAAPSAAATGSVSPFDTTVYPIKCDATSAPLTGLPASVSGNVLLAPCTGTYGDPLVALGLTDPIGTQRGMLFFQDRSATNVAPSWVGSGVGQFLLVGTMYFHSCNASGTGTGCGAAGTYFTDSFSLLDNSTLGSYLYGNIVTDNLVLGQGTPGIKIYLNPTSAYWVLRASLLK